MVQRFYQEARAAARLDHENIARVFSIEHNEAYHYIAFEYIEGITIRQRVVEHGPLPLGEAINYTLQIAGALVHAAERGVVHRDIKPSNIIVTPQGRAKLVDMGLARRFERGASDDDALTQSGVTLGTFDYISPEQARDPRDVDVRSDLYSLGCTLFHMLTGQPPFPQGTVLQKLLQHQEEPPPDARTLNPAVPADLAAILQKLMAKDRDRRYQTPEQLVRDLLTLAGALGLRSISPEGLIWMSAATPSSWERHLIWGLPSLGLVLVVAVLIWLGQPPEATAPADVETTPAVAVAKKSPEPPSAFEPPAAPVAAEKGAPPKETPKAAPHAAPRSWTVHQGDDLEDVLAAAPAGATITLADAGPYELRRPSRKMRPARDLTLRAAASVRAVIRRAGAGTDADGGPLLHLGAGRVLIEDIEFQVAAGADALLVEGADLTLRGCVFRAAGPTTGAAAPVALQVQTAAAEASDRDRPPPVTLESCFFDRDLIALRARGPADILVRDGTFGPAATSFWLDNAEAPAAVPARLVLRHVSIMADNGPVFRLTRTAATIRLEDAVVAALGDAAGTLVATDEPVQLDWVGRDNLYARIDTFLQPTAAALHQEPIRAFDLWAEDDWQVRERGSARMEDTVWASANPLGVLASSSAPTTAFELVPTARLQAEIGARRGPFGPIPTSPQAVAVRTPPPAAADVASNAWEPEHSAADKESSAGVHAPEMPAPMTLADTPRDVGTTPPPQSADPPAAATIAEPSPAAFAQEEPEPTGATKSVPEAPRPPAPKPAALKNAAAMRNSEELLAALRQPSAPPEPIRLLGGVEYVLPGGALTGNGRWILEGPADATAGRPRLRYRPAAEDRADPRAPAELVPAARVLPRAAEPRPGRRGRGHAGGGAPGGLPTGSGRRAGADRLHAEPARLITPVGAGGRGGTGRRSVREARSDDGRRLGA